MARIPNLAIHLSRNVNTEGFKLNKETDTRPILATLLKDELNSTEDPLSKRHAPALLTALAEELGVETGMIVDVDLCLFDTQNGAIGGLRDEFVYAARLDNLASCFSGTRALIRSLEEDGHSEGAVRMVGCFDHEEVGSKSARGADSSMIGEAVGRVCKMVGAEEGAAWRRSLLLSADMAHAVHANYAMKHEGKHRPVMGGGIVVKTNQNQKYATSGVGGMIVRELMRERGVGCQEFVVSNDRGCGSTIGPILAGRVGVRTVDVGQPMLSMHSIREMCAVKDFGDVEEGFVGVFVGLGEMEKRMIGAD